MRFFLISENGDSAGLAWKLKNEGHDVWVYLKNPAARGTLKNMVDQVTSIPIGLEKLPDVVLFDMVGMGKEAERIKKLGYKVIGGGEWNDKLELDRKFAMKAMESFGIKAPLTYAFDNFDDAVDFIATQKKLLVFKPSENLSCAYTFVPKTLDELASFILNLKIEHGVNGPCVLQEFIDGTEVSTEVWYAQGKVVPNPIATFETKKLMYDDVGPSTGCQTSVVFAYPKKEPRIVQQSLKKIHRFVEHIKYTGPLDINGIVKNGKFYGLEFTPRFGYSAIYAFLRILDEPLGEFLVRIANGDNAPMKMKEGFGYSLRVSIPPYPFKSENKVIQKAIYQDTANLLIDGLTDEEWKTSVFPLDVWLSPDGYYTAGFDGVVLEVTGHGSTAYGAEYQAVNLFKKIVLPQKQARLGDGAEVAAKRMDAMAYQGYEMPPFNIAPPATEIAVPTGAVVTSIQPMEQIVIKKESESERIKREDIDLADKLGVRPTAFADPRVKSG